MACRRIQQHCAAALSALLLVSCGVAPTTPPATSDQTLAASSSPEQTGSTLPRIDLPVQPGETVEGLLDVEGHDIYARCSGSGSPTVVYFTGWAPDTAKRGVSVIRAVEGVDGGKHRICSYERRNTGRSEVVKGTQTPEQVVADVDGALSAIGENGPFVLLGASFGGLVAGAYAVAHPDRTAGILLLDSSIPDDFLIDKRQGFDGMCLKANREADAWDSLEKIDTTAASPSGLTTVGLKSRTYRSSTSQPKTPPIAATWQTTRSGRRSLTVGRLGSGSRSAHRIGWMKSPRTWSCRAWSRSSASPTRKAQDEATREPTGQMLL